MLTRNKDTVTLTSATQLTFIVLLLLCLAGVVRQLAFVSETTAQLELHLVFNQAFLTLHPFPRQPDPGTT